MTKQLVLLLLTAMVLTVALLAGCTIAPIERPLPVTGSAAAMPMSPQSLAELVDRAPLIVIAEVGEIAQYVEHAVYGADGKLLPAPTADTSPPLPPAPATDFVLHVEQVIRDDGTVASGNPILLRAPGHMTEELATLARGSDFPLPFTGDRNLFLLAHNPDGGSYGLHHMQWNRLIIDGTLLRLNDSQQTLLHFADAPAPISLEQFIQFVQSR